MPDSGPPSDRGRHWVFFIIFMNPPESKTCNSRSVSVVRNSSQLITSIRSFRPFVNWIPFLPFTRLARWSCFFVLSTGSAAVEAGLVSTPTLARGAHDFACGAMITASHNPAPYNGIKLWNPDGMAFDEAQQREVEEALDRSRFVAPAWDRIGTVFSRSDLVQQHIDTIIKDVGTAKARVVVDCG